MTTSINVQNDIVTAGNLVASNFSSTSFPLSPTAPTNGQVPVYNSGTGLYTPGTPGGGGNVIAGLNGTAGHFISYPGTLNTGTLNVMAISNSGNFTTTISNVAMAQSTTISIPDPGSVTAKFALTTAATTVGNIATYTTIAGGLGQNSGTAINLGNIQAGASGSAGSLMSYSSTASTGYLALTGIANSGNFTITLSNASMGQATTITFPDPGASTATVAYSSVGGNVTAGSNGSAGKFISFPSTSSTGTFDLQAVSNSGNFAVTLQNASMAQATTIIFPDPGGSVADVLYTSTVRPIVIAGSNGSPGSFLCYPPGLNTGTLDLIASNNSGNFNTTISNKPMSQTSTIYIPNPSSTFAAFAITGNFTTPQEISSIVYVSVSIPFSNIATGMSYDIFTISGRTYLLKDIALCKSTNLAGGNRNINISDLAVSNIYTTLLSANVLTPTNAVWGSTVVPLSTTTSLDFNITANIYASVTGGITDYTSGNLNLLLELVQIA